MESIHIDNVPQSPYNFIIIARKFGIVKDSAYVYF